MFTKITLLGYDSHELTWKVSEGYTEIWLPEMARVQHLKHAWVLKMTELANDNENTEDMVNISIMED